jgi:hypothetical protein
MMDKVLRFYAPGDFHDMAGMGVNAVRIPEPCRAFHDHVVVNGDFLRMVLWLLDRAEGAGLKAILVLVGGVGEDVLGLRVSMEKRRDAPPPDDDNNNNKQDSTASRCAFTRQFVGLALVGRPGPFPRQPCVVIDVGVDGSGEREAGQCALVVVVV